MTVASIHYLFLTHEGYGHCMKTVYLCGGINGLSDSACKDWRAEASAALIPGFYVLDPMRRDYRGKEAENVAAIVHGDLFDIQASQIMLVNCAKPSWGTAMEIVYAKHRGPNGNPPVVVGFNAPEKPSPWLVFHCDKLYATLSEALDHVKGLA